MIDIKHINVSNMVDFFNAVFPLGLLLIFVYLLID